MRVMGNSITFKNLPSITECDAFLRQQNLSYGKAVREQVNIVLNQVRQEISKKRPELFLTIITKY